MPQTVTVELTKPIAGLDGEKITSVTLRSPTLQELVGIGLAVKRREFYDDAAFFNLLTENIADLREYIEKSIVAPRAIAGELDPVDLRRLQDALAGLITGGMAAALKTPLPFLVEKNPKG
jgi:hypothetical protein